jgi:hypothetical protein
MAGKRFGFLQEKEVLAGTGYKNKKTVKFF